MRATKINVPDHALYDRRRRSRGHVQRRPPGERGSHLQRARGQRSCRRVPPCRPRRRDLQRTRSSSIREQLSALQAHATVPRAALRGPLHAVPVQLPGGARRCYVKDDRRRDCHTRGVVRALHGAAPALRQDERICAPRGVLRRRAHLPGQGLQTHRRRGDRPLHGGRAVQSREPGHLLLLPRAARAVGRIPVGGVLRASPGHGSR